MVFSFLSGEILQSATQMEPEFFNGSQFPSNSAQNSILTIPILPLELITEILSRLPVKSLLKFRSVSKSWLALISSPEFIKTHLSLSANNKNKEDTHHVLFLDIGDEKSNYKECPLKSLFHDSVTEALEMDFPIENDIDWIYVIGSCNGLLYITERVVEYSLLWNPTTRKHKKLPPFRPRCEGHKAAAYGFGYDELHDDYKVVMIIYYNDIIRGSDDIEVKVYSLKSDSWTSIDYCDETFSSKKSVGYCGDKLISEGLYVDGKLHWGTSISKFDEYLGKNIICFDLANEKWEKIEKPSYGEGETELGVGKLGSDLCIFTHDYKTTDLLGAWVMKEYYGVKESWIKMFTITFPDNLVDNQNFFVSNKGEILTVFGTTSMIYNSKDESFRYSDITNCLDGQFPQFYLESLVCPNSTRGTENAEKAHIETIE